MLWISGTDLLVNREDEFILMEKKYGLFMQIRQITGLNGEGRWGPESGLKPIRRSTGANPGTSSGRGRFRDSGTRRPSSGGTGSM